MLGSKKEPPLIFSHIRHGAGEDVRQWVCEGCGKYYLRFAESGTSQPVATPLVSLEVPSHRASGFATRAEFDASLVRINRTALPWLGMRTAASCYLDYCRDCGAKAAEMRKRLAQDAQTRTTKPVILPGLHLTAIKSYLAKEARMWGIPEDFSDIEWACIKCHKRVNWGASKVVEEPLLKWQLPQIKDPYGRVTAGAAVASLCQKCARVIDPVARQAFQNQVTGVTT
jgi:hypothetical protein